MIFGKIQFDSAFFCVILNNIDSIMELDNLPLSNNEKTHYTNWWCRSIGIKSRDLDNHPTIDDAIFLIQFRQVNWNYMTRSEQAVWGSYWSWVYHKQINIKKAWLTKLAHITESVIIRQNKELETREKIKAMRQRKQNEKESVNMTANPLSDSMFA
jgi:hypothetical protein